MTFVYMYVHVVYECVIVWSLYWKCKFLQSRPTLFISGILCACFLLLLQDEIFSGLEDEKEPVDCSGGFSNPMFNPDGVNVCDVNSLYNVLVTMQRNCNFVHTVKPGLKTTSI